MPIVLDGNNLATYGLLGSLPPVTTNGASSYDITGIPSTAKRVTVLLNSLSLNGSQNVLVQFGSGSILTTGYLSSWQQLSGGVVSSNLTSTSGIIYGLGAASNILMASTTFYLLSNNVWLGSGTQTYDNSLTYGAFITTKSPSLSGSLERIRITNTGSDTFDGGSVTVYYEG